MIDLQNYITKNYKEIIERVNQSAGLYIQHIILLYRLKCVLPKKINGFLFSMDGDGIRPLTKGAFKF